MAKKALKINKTITTPEWKINCGPHKLIVNTETLEDSVADDGYKTFEVELRGTFVWRSERGDYSEYSAMRDAVDELEDIMRKCCGKLTIEIT